MRNLQYMLIGKSISDINYISKLKHIHACVIYSGLKTLKNIYLI